jgi:ABC-type Fe3+-hydroxamate transport system substrate-binding protein
MLRAMNARSALISLSVAAALGLSACGGGSSSASGKPQADGTYKKADLAVAADKVCKQTKDSAKTIKPVTDPSDPVAVATYLEQLLPITQKQATGLAALKPAPDVSADWSAILAKQQEIVSFFAGVLQKAKTKDPSGQEDLQKGAALGPQIIALFKKIGSKTCAS